MAMIEMIEQSTKLLQRFSKKKKFYKTKHEEINEQPAPPPIPMANSFLSPPPIMTRSDLSRSISNNSITFASVFDQSDNETPTCHLDLSNESGDLVIVVPNKFVTNEPILQANNSEPYPFRSEMPKSHSSNYLSPSNFSRKRSLRNLLHSRRPKKLHHPIRTKSAPDLIPTMIQPISHRQQQQQRKKLKPIRRWFKSSSVGRLIHTFLKHPTPVYSNQIESKSPISLSKYSDVIY